MATAAEVTALAAARRARRSQLALAARLAASRAWQRLDPDRLTQSWDAGVGRQLVLAVTAAQLKAAQGAQGYVADVLAAQGFDSEADADVVAESLAGIASDGRPLASLFFQSVLSTRDHLGAGVAQREALDAGYRQLAMMVETQVTDAGRVADGLATVTNRRSRRGGYVRVLTPPSCGRCAILAGNIYASERAFQRHPRCDCIHVPVGDRRAGDALVTDPVEYFRSLSAAQQAKAFTVAGAQAIRDGAEPAQVVNARRGMYSAGGVSFTREGTSRRGWAAFTARQAGQKLGRRLMPEGIYQLASTQEEVLQLLRRFGYIT